MDVTIENELRDYFLAQIREMSKQAIEAERLLLTYLLCDYDFSNDIRPFDTADALSAIIESLESEENEVFRGAEETGRQKFALLGLHFLAQRPEYGFSRRRRHDFANFCAFIIRAYGGGPRESSRVAGEEAVRHQKRDWSLNANIKKHKPNNDFRQELLSLYEPAARALGDHGKKITYKSISREILREVDTDELLRKYGLPEDNYDDLQGTLLRWIDQGVAAKKLPSSKTLKQKYTSP